MKHLLELLIFVVVVSQYSTLGRRIVEREDVNTPATLGADGVEIEKGGGFPPYNYTEPNESEDDGQVDFDLDATTTTTTVATTTTITTTITLEPEALEDIDHSPVVDHFSETDQKSKTVPNSKLGGRYKHQESVSTFKHLKKRINAEMFKMYRYMPLVQSFTWLSGVFAVLTVLFKIHEVYLS
ncbi:uncharacterized protein LOC128987178 isoform X1 [Macrosteles quadrilineatus]|uniref:uncharacterized protein LOC128987178 isoform X1 n=1 Tax=Macrosteles quadrilineatus TaxID=74068 RepID=UPI0023E2C464|nr:uncharacterized protein LOC128987178 isoform X1 [Macrosteles quadrilineatus]